MKRMVRKFIKFSDEEKKISYLLTIINEWNDNKIFLILINDDWYRLLTNEMTMVDSDGVFLFFSCYCINDDDDDDDDDYH